MSTVFRIHKISIQHYKGIDSLVIEWPDFESLHLNDVTLLGSKNGAGKTSILECCTLLLAAFAGMLPQRFRRDDAEFIGGDFPKSTISGEITDKKNTYSVCVDIEKNMRVHVKVDGAEPLKGSKKIDLDEILGQTAEPVQGKGFLLLHGYRKMREGRIELGSLVNDSRDDREVRYYPSMLFRRSNSSLGTFKQMVMKWMLKEAGLLETGGSGADSSLQAGDARNVLERLLRVYAHVKIDKLRPYPDSSFNLLVRPLGPTDAPAFPIDGLSSGQKEIISTLYMIWEATLENPCVVMIDEPEMHLNAGWHRGYIQELTHIAPHNQYIIATHSETFMSSVEPEQRIYIES